MDDLAACCSCLVFCPKGDAVAFSEGRRLHIWNTEDNGRHMILDEHATPISSIAFSRDGKCIAVATVRDRRIENGKESIQEGELKVWNALTGRLERTLKFTLDNNWVAFSPDGQFLAAAGSDNFRSDTAGEVRIWNVTTGEEMATTTCHDRTTRCISFSPDGKLLVAGGSDGRVVLLGCADWQERFAFPGNGDDVVNVAFSADGTTLAIANNEGDVKLIGPSTHNATAIMALCDIHIARKNWQAALEAINRAVEKSPNPPGALQSRASVYLGLGEWKKRQADVEKAIESETANHYAHYEHALLCLILNEAPKYRDACAAMVRKFGQSDDPTAAYWAAWTCVLAADAIDEYEPVLACTTKAVEAQPDSDQFLNTLGAILYRAGRHDEAIERLAVLDRRWKTADGAVQSSPAYTWYFLAMAHLKAGNEDQAREYLNKANQSTDDEFADKEKPPPWNRRATLELLRKEAEALLGTDVEKSAESNQRPEGEEK